MRAAALLAALLGAAAPVAGDEARVAVAANFAPTLEALAPLFTEATGHRVLASSGSTGKLFAQIEQGAPFDVFLAADAEHPRLLEERGLTVPGSRFRYARGRLVLWSAGVQFAGDGPAVLAGGGFRHLAIANPELAPYGEAAMAVLERLGLAERLRPRLVLGESIAQAFQFVASGAAELGFVAASQLVGVDGGWCWPVPEDWHAPLDQEAVLLARGGGKAAARAFLDFLRGEAAAEVLHGFGYAVP